MNKTGKESLIDIIQNLDDGFSDVIIYLLEEIIKKIKIKNELSSKVDIVLNNSTSYSESSEYSRIICEALSSYYYSLRKDIDIDSSFLEIYEKQ